MLEENRKSPRYTEDFFREGGDISVAALTEMVVRAIGMGVVAQRWFVVPVGVAVHKGMSNRLTTGRRKGANSFHLYQLLVLSLVHVHLVENDESKTDPQIEYDKVVGL